MIDKFKDLGKDAPDDLPSFAWISLARRGMEKISLDQCFLEGCDNADAKLLETKNVETFEEENKQIKIILRHCKKCSRDFKLKLEDIKRVARPAKTKGDEEALSMGIVYALDADGNNLGHVGYY